MTKNNVIVPIVHLNGDSKSTLLEDHLKSLRAVRDAIEALPEVNGRNYYPVPGLWDKALEQKERWKKKLTEVYRELEELVEAIEDIK